LMIYPNHKVIYKHNIVINFMIKNRKMSYYSMTTLKKYKKKNCNRKILLKKKKKPFNYKNLNLIKD
jgi:hypothetical protein